MKRWARILLCILALPAIGGPPSFAQAQSNDASVAPFTREQLWGLWKQAFSSRQLLKSVDDFTRTMPVCFDTNGFYEEHGLAVLASLKPVNVFLGPGPGPTGEYWLMYVFQITFRDRLHNPLYKYWLRDFPADYRPVKSIPEIAIQIGIGPDEAGSSQHLQNISYVDGFQLDSSGFEVLVASDKDPTPTSYDDFEFHNYFGGVDFGTDITPDAPECK